MKRYIPYVFLFPLMDACAYEEQRAINNLAHDYAECSAYYFMTARIVEAQDKSLSVKNRKAGEYAMELSSGLTNEKLAGARIEMAIKSMSKEIDYDASNFSILLNKYSDHCVEIINTPEARLKYWLEQTD